MSRLKYLVAACVLALTVAVGNASTFSVNGEFDSFVGVINPFTPGGTVDMSQFPLPTTVNGTLTFNNGALTSLMLFVSPSAVFNSPSGFFYTTSTTFSDDLNWTFALNFFDPFGGLGEFVTQLDLTLTSTAGMLAATLFKIAQPGTPAFDSYVGNFTDFHGTVSQVPLPGALPLFVTGLVALGLLGWRRKRKAQAAA